MDVVNVRSCRKPPPWREDNEKMPRLTLRIIVVRNRKSIIEVVSVSQQPLYVGEKKAQH